MYTCIVKTELRIVIVGSTSPEFSDDDEVLYNDGISYILMTRHYQSHGMMRQIVMKNQ